MTVEEFEARFAAWEISGEGDWRWHIAGIVAAIRNEGITSRMTQAGHSVEPGDLIDPDELLPMILRPKKKKRRSDKIRASDPHAAETLARRTKAI